MHHIQYKKSALKDLEKLQNNKKALQKIEELIKEISINPYSSTNKFERLKHDLSGFCCKRWNKKDRIIYQVIDQEIVVLVISVLGHYEL